MNLDITRSVKFANNDYNYEAAIHIICNAEKINFNFIRLLLDNGADPNNYLI